MIAESSSATRRECNTQFFPRQARLATRVAGSLDSGEYCSASGFSPRRFEREGFQGRGAVSVLGFPGAEGFVGDGDAGAGGAEGGGSAGV